MERVERAEDAAVMGGALDGIVSDESAGRVFWTPPAASDLPEEPAPVEAGDGKRGLLELRTFHVHGRRPEGRGDGAGAAPLPALLHPYRDLSRVRHEYPLIINGSGPTPARPLTAALDEALASASATGDEGEQLRHAVLRLEAIVRSLLADRERERLSLVWDRAAAALFETSPLPAERVAALREGIGRVRGALGDDGQLISCGPGAATRIFAACASAHWRERCSGWGEDLDTLVRRLEDVLVADFGHSEEALAPGHLRDTLGDETDVDAGAMSSLLRAVPRGGGLSEVRRERVREAVSTLRAMQPVFAADPVSGDRAPIRHDAVFADCAAAREEHRKRMQAMTAFFKAVRIARLEIQNHYREAAHDPYFDQFGERHLTADETALCPPVLLRVCDDELGLGGGAELLELLDSTGGVKILLEIRHPYTVRGDAPQPAVSIGWTTRIAGMATALAHPFVLQAPVSRATVLYERMLQGFRRPGPALFCVAAPRSEALPPYLAAAAVAESRVLPVVTYDPWKGATLADRFDLGDNPQNERTWPVERFAHRRGGEEVVIDLAFTPADLLFVDPRLSGHFWAAPPEAWHDAMVPLHELLELPVNEAAGRIPYIRAVDRDHHALRVVVSRAVVDLCRRCRTHWLGLREWGGVENSFVAREVATERERLAAEKEREVEAIEKNYLAQLEQDVGELTREIVQRIAAQLVGMESAPVAPPMPAAAPAPRRESAPPAEAKAAPAAAPEKEEDEVVAIDDAYIDTPLCTSCNECTQLNPTIFRYNANKQAEIGDATAGPFSDIVRAAELCPVHIIHPGKPKNPSEPGLEDWIARAARYN